MEFYYILRPHQGRYIFYAVQANDPDEAARKAAEAQDLLKPDRSAEKPLSLQGLHSDWWSDHDLTDEQREEDEQTEDEMYESGRDDVLIDEQTAYERYVNEPTRGACGMGLPAFVDFRFIWSTELPKELTSKVARDIREAK
jgi:hypothetical protein